MPRRMTSSEQLASLAAIILSYLREIAEYVMKDRTEEKAVLDFFLSMTDYLGMVTDLIFDREVEMLTEILHVIDEIAGGKK